MNELTTGEEMRLAGGVAHDVLEKLGYTLKEYSSDCKGTYHTMTKDGQVIVIDITILPLDKAKEM